MPDLLTGFVPFGEWKPDLGHLANDGLVRALNVVPVHGSYLTAPASLNISVVNTDADAKGLHIHLATGDGYAAAAVPGAPTKVHLYQLTDAGSKLDRSKAALYDATAEFYGASFGPHVIMANGVDAVQYRDAGSAALFADMITSTFAPIGRFPFALRNNLFLANCSLSAPYDGLAAGANPTLVAWSQSDNLRAYGSARVNPELIGAGYQPLNFDIGDITGAIGGVDFAIVAHSNGFVRVEGPPYVFRVVADGSGCLFPYTLCRVRNDTYFFGPAGLCRLPGGEGPVEFLGIGKFTRSLLDNATGFHEAAWTGDATVMSMAYDAVNDLLLLAYRSNLESSGWSNTYITYNIAEDRATYSLSPIASGATRHPLQYLRTTRQGALPLAAGWCPGRDMRYLTEVGTQLRYERFLLNQTPNAAVLERGYMQLKPGYTTRIRRIRPVYRVTDQTAAEQISAHILTTNKPYATPTTSGPFSTLDTGGWITCPESVFGVFNAPRFTMAINLAMWKTVEWEGFEYEAEVGGVYGA